LRSFLQHEIILDENMFINSGVNYPVPVKCLESSLFFPKNTPAEHTFSEEFVSHE